MLSRAVTGTAAGIQHRVQAIPGRSSCLFGFLRLLFNRPNEKVIIPFVRDFQNLSDAGNLLGRKSDLAFHSQAHRLRCKSNIPGDVSAGFSTRDDIPVKCRIQSSHISAPPFQGFHIPFLLLLLESRGANTNFLIFCLQSRCICGIIQAHNPWEAKADRPTAYRIAEKK